MAVKSRSHVSAHGPLTSGLARDVVNARNWQHNSISNGQFTVESLGTIDVGRN